MAALANSQRREKCSDDGVSCVCSTTTSRPARGDRAENPERERRAKRKIFQKHMKLVQNSVRAYNIKSANAKPTHESLEMLNRLMADVDISIQNLCEEQLSCLKDVLQEQRSHTKKNPPKRTLKKTDLSDRNFPAEVKALADFLLKTGGPYGGWEQCDHQVFLRILMMHSGKSFCKEEVKLYLPGKTLEEIEKHKDWHQELLRFKDKQREAIQRWKANKLQQQRQTVEDAHKRELKARELDKQRRARRNMKEKERIMQLKKGREAIKPANDNESERTAEGGED